MMSLRTLTALALTSTAVAACGVNELPAYRGQIHTVTVAALVSGDAEFSVEPAAMTDEGDGTTPGDAASAATERFILSAVEARLATLDPDALAATFGAVFAPDVSRGTGWALDRLGAPVDARVVAEVDGFGLDIDSLGRAEVYFRMTARAYFEADNRLIYQSWSSHRVPLVLDGYGPSAVLYADDPEAMAVERAYNLLLLEDLGASGLRAVVTDAARDAAAVLARELVEASWQ